MDFEEFRKKKKAQQDADKQAEEKASQPTASGKPADWIDGFGPAGPSNPKVKGFLLGRYRKKKVDPSTLAKPEGYEATYRKEAEEKTQAEVELERKMAQLERMQAELEAAQAKQREAEIEARRKAEGFGSIKGRQRF